jgi:hypothetical protein
MTMRSHESGGRRRRVIPADRGWPGMPRRRSGGSDTTSIDSEVFDHDDIEGFYDIDGKTSESITRISTRMSPSVSSESGDRRTVDRLAVTVTGDRHNVCKV